MQTIETKTIIVNRNNALFPVLNISLEMFNLGHSSPNGSYYTEPKIGLKNRATPCLTQGFKQGAQPNIEVAGDRDSSVSLKYLNAAYVRIDEQLYRCTFRTEGAKNGVNFGAHFCTEDDIVKEFVLKPIATRVPVLAWVNRVHWRKGQDYEISEIGENYADFTYYNEPLKNTENAPEGTPYFVRYTVIWREKEEAKRENLQIISSARAEEILTKND